MQKGEGKNTFSPARKNTAKWKDELFAAVKNKNIEKVLILIPKENLYKIIPGDGLKRRSLRHDLRSCLGFLKILKDPKNRKYLKDPQKAIDEYFKILKELLCELFNDTKFIESSYCSLKEVLTKMPNIKKTFYKENCVDNKKIENQQFMTLLLRLRQNITQNIEDLKNDFINVSAYPFVMEDDGRIVVAFPNDGPLIQENIFRNLGRIGNSSKSGRHERGIGLSGCAETAKQIGVRLFAMQKNNGRENRWQVRDLTNAGYNFNLELIPTIQKIQNHIEKSNRSFLPNSSHCSLAFIMVAEEKKLYEK